ncbi:hypothetical protein [Sorangium sp. So ce1151]|uniref:hypothetical protein n=1 Tax=Sorangium sp. So ce1151 TaxID=3133332 RepID=UPI003F624740
MRSAAFLLAAVPLFLVPAVVEAQTSDAQTAVATALFEQAVAEMDQKDYASACRKLEEAMRLAPQALGAQLKLAQCYEADGKLASAWMRYTVVRDVAERSGQAERAEKAAAGAAALKDKLARMILEVPDAVRAIPGLAITRDGVLVGEGQWGAAVPVDRGTHAIVVTAPGREPWKRDVPIEADGARISVLVEAPVAAPETPPATPAAVVARALSPAEPAPASAPSLVPDAALARPWQRPAGIAAAAVGFAGLVAGGVLGAVAVGTYAESNDGHCDAWNICDPEGMTLRQGALRLGDASTATLVVGGAALIGGVVLLATMPGPSVQGRQGTSAGVVFEVVAGGARVRGTF